MTALRKAQDGLEVLEIQMALERMLLKSPAPQMQYAVPEIAYRHLKHAVASGLLYVIGDFAILVDVGAPWYTDKLWLIEEIVIRWRKSFGNPVEEAIAAMADIGREHGCVAVAAGDTQIGLMADRYIAAGFQPLGTQFYKEIP